ncbi:MAG: hypothetical protein IJ799_03465 [Bacteroidales bacterium]|nr:hypothetical protein [Bacteroidales bacterium]
MNKFRFLTSLAAAFIAAACLSATPAAFIARWEFSSGTRNSGTWVKDHSVLDKTGTGTLSFVGSAPKFGYNKSGSVTVSNVCEGDYFLLSAPVSRLPKGTDVDVAVMMGISAEGGPEKWICEYFDGKRWKNTGEDVSFTLKKYKSSNETSYMKTFTLKKALRGPELKVRLRCLETGSNPSSSVYFMQIPRYGLYLAAWPEGSKGSKRVLMLGNSFTFFGSSNLALLEIAHSQGHGIDAGINVKGGQNFGQHMKLEKSLEAIAAGGYEAALLQNQSQGSSFYASDPVKYSYIMDDAKAIAAEVRKYSPSCRLVLERTWSSPKEDWRGYGNAEAFDADLYKGSEQLAAAMGADISPIGDAFIVARAAGLPLYWKDDFHQNHLGAYLKACVNYLVLFGEPFREGVSDYGLDPGHAARCREIAEEIVLKR